MFKRSNLVVKVGVIVLPTAFMVIPPSPAWARRNQFDVCVEQIVRSGVAAEKAGTACSDALIPKELSRCVAMLRSKTAVTPDHALQACYRVRRPVDLANCVIDIDKGLLANQGQVATREEPSPSPEATTSPDEPEPVEIENQPIIEENQQSTLNKPQLIAQAPSTPETPTEQSSEDFSLKWQTQFVPDENSPPLLVALDSCRRSLLPGRYSECVIGLGNSASLSPIAAMNTCLEVQAFPTDIFPVYDSQTESP